MNAATLSDQAWEWRAKHPQTGEVFGPWFPCSAKAAERARACGYEVRTKATFADGLEQALNDAYAEGRKDEAADWNNVGRNGPPPRDGETVFVGINTAGFACCFNEVTHDGVCSMQGPEICTVQMSGLEWWRVLSRPPESA